MLVPAVLSELQRPRRAAAAEPSPLPPESQKVWEKKFFWVPAFFPALDLPSSSSSSLSASSFFSKLLYALPFLVLRLASATPLAWLKQRVPASRLASAWAWAKSPFLFFACAGTPLVLRSDWGIRQEKPMPRRVL